MKVPGKILIIFILFVAGIMIGLTFKKTPAVAPTLNNGINGSSPANQAPDIVDENEFLVDLILDYGNQDIQAYNNIKLQVGQSVFDLLKKVVTENDLELSYKRYDASLGALIDSINNIKNDHSNGSYWQYWVNGEYANIGASNYILSSGDKIEWKYTDNKY